MMADQVPSDGDEELVEGDGAVVSTLQCSDAVDLTGVASSERWSTTLASMFRRLSRLYAQPEPSGSAR